MANSTHFISGICHWAKVHQPHFDQYNEDGIFSIDVELTDATKKKLKEDLGLTAGFRNKNDERGEFFTFKRKYKRRDGTKQTPPKVVDSQKNPISPDILIGNGSKVNVAFTTYDWERSGKKGKSASLSAVQVVNLVAYDPDGSNTQFEKTKGYEAPKNNEAQEEGVVGDPF